MAVPVYGAGTSGAGASSNSITYSSPSVSGSNTIGVVMMFSQTDTTNFASTWNGAACTSLGGTTNGSERVEAFYKIAPTAGVNNIVSTRTGSSNDFRSFAAYYTGAKQSAQPDVSLTIGPTTSGTCTGTATIVAQDSILMMWIRGDAGLSYTAGANTTLRGSVSSIQHADSGTTSLSPGSRSIVMTSSSQMFHGPVWALAPVPGTAYTMTAALGTFTLTGIAALFRIAVRVVAALGTFTLTGVAATFRLGKGITAGVGSFILTGIAASMRGPRRWTNQDKSATPSWANQDKNNSL